MTLEGLDTRRLFATAVLQGTAGDDVIVMGNSGSDGYFFELNGTRTSARFRPTDTIRRLSLDAAGGNDRITFARDFQFASTISGGDGRDTIIGSDASETILGGVGGDSIIANGGDDTIVGGAGPDRIDGRDGDDVIFTDGDDNFDNTTRNAFPDVARGGEGDDDISGLTFKCSNSVFDGGTGDDHLNYIGGEGEGYVRLRVDGIANDGHVDQFALGTANNIIAFENFHITPVQRLVFDARRSRVPVQVEFDLHRATEYTDVYGSEFGDTIIAVSDSLLPPVRGFSIEALGGNDTIHGSEASEQINGGSGDDLIYGHGGRDGLNGDEGNDSIQGGGGADVILGNAGRDTLVGSGGSDFLVGGSDPDFIFGGQGNDRAKASDEDTVADVELLLNSLFE